MNLVLVGILLIIVAAIFFFLMLIIGKKGNFKADIFEERADGSAIIMYSNVKIQLVKKKGEIDKWKALGTGIPAFQPKSKDFLYPYPKKKTDKCYLFRDRDGNIHPCRLEVDSENNIMIKPVFKDQMEFIVTEQEEKAKIKEKKGTWEKYQGFITIVVCGMIIFLVMFFSYQHEEKANSAIDTYRDAALKQIESKANEYGDIIQRASQIVQQQQTLDRTANWTQTNAIIGG